MLKEIALVSSLALAAFFVSNHLQSTSNEQFLKIPAIPESANSFPIIGIFTEPSDYSEYPEGQYSYIAASYVKFIESAGARVVPIPYETDNSTLETIFQQVNGILFPGGGVELDGPTKFTQSLSYMLHRAMKANDEGDFFPILAVCLGHEAVHYILSGYNDKYLIRVFNESARSHYLNVTNKNALLYKDLNNELYQSMVSEEVIYYNHVWGVAPKFYQQAPVLNDYLEITALNTDDAGIEYIASTQGIKYPIITTQYHAEKNIFEWKIPANHTLNAVKISQNHADVFVDLARRNTHKFDSKTREKAAMIYNHQNVQLDSSSFQQIYPFVYGQLEKVWQ